MDSNQHSVRVERTALAFMLPPPIYRFRFLGFRLGFIFPAPVLATAPPASKVLLGLNSPADLRCRRTDVCRFCLWLILYTPQQNGTVPGKPFDEGDVRGICGIAEGNKEVNDVGKFGIGFKAVYAYAQAPRVYSGDERFAIDSYVRPRPVDSVSLREGETRFVLPFRPETGRNLKQEVWEGFRLLTSESLVFLREVRKVTLRVDGQVYGVFTSDWSDVAGVGGCSEVQTSIRFRVGNTVGKSEERRWLVFARDVSGPERAGSIEIGFEVKRDGSRVSLVKMDQSYLGPVDKP